MEDGQLLVELSVRALKSKEFSEGLHGADIPPPGESNCVLSDEAGPRVKGKNGIAKQLKPTTFNKSNDLRLPELISEQVRQILCWSVAFEVEVYGLKHNRIFFLFVCLYRDKPVQWDMRGMSGTCSNLCGHFRDD